MVLITFRYWHRNRIEVRIRLGTAGIGVGTQGQREPGLELGCGVQLVVGSGEMVQKEATYC